MNHRLTHLPTSAYSCHITLVECLLAEPESDQTMEDTKRLLFVCVENANRSQMAEAFARLLGGENVNAYSAGSKPSGQVNPRAVEAMGELGYDLNSHRSVSLDALAEQEFDFVATMGCGDSCPWIRATVRQDWDIPDPKDLPPDEFRVVRDMICEKVRNALVTLGISPASIDLG